MFDQQQLLDLYSGRGSEAHDPRILLKFVLYQHRLGNTKPSEWSDKFKSDDYVKWLTFGSHVSRTTLYDFRDRVEPILQKLNAEVVKSSVDKQLINAEKASFDGTYVAANSSRSKLLNLKKVQQRLEQIQQEIARRDPTLWLSWTCDTFEQQTRPAWLATTDLGLRLQQRTYQKAQIRLKELLAANAKRRSDKRKPTDKVVLSVADSDAVFGRDKLKVFRPLYNVQTICDLASEMILGYEVFAQVSDSGTLQPMLERLIQNGVTLEGLLADAGYPTGEDLAYCHRQGVTLYAPWQENSFTAAKKVPEQENAKFTQDDFQWDEDDHVYRCPAGATLSFAEKKTRQRADGTRLPMELYRAEAESCARCPLAVRCTTSDRGRSVRRDPHQDLIDALKARMETFEAKLLYRLRGQTIERIYADQKEHRNMGRFRGRTLSRARAQCGITVLVHNLCIAHRLLKARTRGETRANDRKLAA